MPSVLTDDLTQFFHTISYVRKKMGVLNVPIPKPKFDQFLNVNINQIFVFYSRKQYTGLFKHFIYLKIGVVKFTTWWKFSIPQSLSITLGYIRGTHTRKRQLHTKTPPSVIVTFTKLIHNKLTQQYLKTHISRLSDWGSTRPVRKTFAPNLYLLYETSAHKILTRY